METDSNYSPDAKSDPLKTNHAEAHETEPSEVKGDFKSRHEAPEAVHSRLYGLDAVDVSKALREGHLVPNERYQQDYEDVIAFLQLKGQPSRPLYPQIRPKSQEEYETVKQLLSPDFFTPFNSLLELLGWAPLRLEPERDAIETWNNDDYLRNLVAAVERGLDNGQFKTLIPRLVAVYLNLEVEKPPQGNVWASIDAIAIPGSRTYDRPAEAFRAYLRSEGRAALITSGKAPFYDDDNNNIELSEAEANAAYLRMLGVPNKKIHREAASEDTEENADYLAVALSEVGAKRSHPVKNLLLVTSPYHLARYSLNVALMTKRRFPDIHIYSIGARACRYWPESYFLHDDKSGYTREASLGVVFNEYLKIAFDMCGQLMPRSVKENAPRTE